MKIIDKRNRKDYYDYLTGIYGIDEKLILDRRGGTNIQFYPDVIRLHIAGYIVEGICIDKKFYYGEALNKFKVKKDTRRWLSKHYKRNYDKSIAIKFQGSIWREEWVYLEPVKSLDDMNIKENCPILIETGYNNDYSPFPILKEMNLGSFIKPEIIYQWLTEWLSNQIFAREKSEPMTNNEKIISKGFDNKTSFRPKYKR
jgi:hypothetical protein